MPIGDVKKIRYYHIPITSNIKKCRYCSNELAEIEGEYYFFLDESSGIAKSVFYYCENCAIGYKLRSQIEEEKSDITNVIGKGCRINTINAEEFTRLETRRSTQTIGKHVSTIDKALMASYDSVTGALSKIGITLANASIEERYELLLLATKLAARLNYRYVTLDTWIKKYSDDLNEKQINQIKELLLNNVTDSKSREKLSVDVFQIEQDKRKLEEFIPNTPEVLPDIDASEAPDIQDVPEAPEIREVPEIPETREVPKVTGTPGTSGIPYCETDADGSVDDTITEPEPKLIPTEVKEYCDLSRFAPYIIMD